MIVPGGGLSLDGARWVAARSNFLVHVKVLARLFRGKMLAMLMHAHDAGELKFFNTHAGLADKRTFKRFIAPLPPIPKSSRMLRRIARACCPCPRCGARMIVIELFARGCEPSWRPTPISIDTS